MNVEFWQNILMFAQRQKCFCAFCKTPKKVYKRRSLSLFEVVGLALFALLLTSVIWEHLDPRGLVILISLLTLGEFFFRIRWRNSTICSNCGFDPVVYVKNPDIAAQKVKVFLDDRKENPHFLLKPTIQLPVRRVQAGSDVSVPSNSKISLRV